MRMIQVVPGPQSNLYKQREGTKRPGAGDVTGHKGDAFVEEEVQFYYCNAFESGAKPGIVAQETLVYLSEPKAQRRERLTWNWILPLKRSSDQRTPNKSD